MGLCVLELAEEQGEGAQCEPLAARRAEGDGGGRSTVGCRARSREREARRRGGPDHAGVAPTRRIFTDYRSQLAGFSQAMEMMSTRMGSTVSTSTDDGAPPMVLAREKRARQESRRYPADSWTR